MSKTILIFANCWNSTAKGDYALAGSIAADLNMETVEQDIKIVLTTTQDRLPHYEKLYGAPVNGKLTINGQRITVCALELFDTTENEVMAYINANRCLPPATELLKRILSPQSKILYITAANQGLISAQETETLLQIYSKQQPGIAEHFDSHDIERHLTGIGAGRIGLPNISTAAELPPLSAEQQEMIPNSDFGFMYLGALAYEKTELVIAQYVRLTDRKSHYVLVGDFSDRLPVIQAAIFLDAYKQDRLMRQALPEITLHTSLNNTVMRQVLVASSSPLIVSTGVMSTLEALLDGKLSFYQYSDVNEGFVQSYLLAVQSLCSSDDSLFGTMPQLIFELSNLLFAVKPLTPDQLSRTRELLSISNVPDRLIATNKRIVNNAKGTLAPQLLSIIGKPRQTQENQQLATVCASLRKPNEANSPVYDQALRRAAAKGCVFELKVLIKSMSAEEINKRDLSDKQYTALHWAARFSRLDCAKLLIKAGAVVNAQDGYGKTALDHAKSNDDESMIAILIAADPTTNNELELDAVADTLTYCTMF